MWNSRIKKFKFSKEYITAELEQVEHNWVVSLSSTDGNGAQVSVIMENYVILYCSCTDILCVHS